MHEFTDGCAAHYKSRHCFGDTSNSCRDFGYTTFTRNFFETAHAKGPHDAAGGLLKRQADIAVLRGRASIQSASDLFEFATTNLTNTKAHCRRRLFRYVDTIPRENSLRFKPVPSIRSVHQVIVTAGNSDSISIRELSCFSCDKCASGIFGECENQLKTGNFTEVKIVHEDSNQPEVLVDDLGNAGASECLSGLVTKGQIIAVLADDENSEYFLLKVTKEVFPLNKQTSDSWGACLPAGTEVISGLYYDKDNSNPLVYKLVPKKIANVPAQSVVYICSELNATTTIDLNEDVHLNIIQCLNEMCS